MTTTYRVCVHEYPSIRAGILQLLAMLKVFRETPDGFEKEVEYWRERSEVVQWLYENSPNHEFVPTHHPDIMNGSAFLTVQFKNESDAVAFILALGDNILAKSED